MQSRLDGFMLTRRGEVVRLPFSSCLRIEHQIHNFFLSLYYAIYEGLGKNLKSYHYDKVLTEQSERHYIEREGRGKTRTLRSRQRDSIVQKQVLITKHKP